MINLQILTIIVSKLQLLKNKYKTMGVYNSSSRDKLSKIIPQFEAFKWKDVTSSHRALDDKQMINSLKIYQSIQDKTMVQSHILIMTSQQGVESLFKQLEWRKSCAELVQVKMAMLKNSSKFCGCGGNPEFQLMTEYVPRRMNQLDQMSYPFNIYLLSQITKGFKFLFGKYPMINFQEDLVFITSDLKVKVWMNTDITSNDLSIHLEENQQGIQTFLMYKIVRSVTQRTYKHNNPSDIQSYLGSMEELTFQKVLAKIEEYVKKFNIQVPDSLSYLNQDNFNPEIGFNNIQRKSYEGVPSITAEINRKTLSTQHTQQNAIQHVQTKAEVQIVKQFRQSSDDEVQRPVLNQSEVNINVGRQSVFDKTGNGKCNEDLNSKVRNTQNRKNFDCLPAVSKKHSDHKSPLLSTPDVNVDEILKKQNQEESSTLNEEGKRQNQVALLYVLSNK